MSTTDRVKRLMINAQIENNENKLPGGFIVCGGGTKIQKDSERQTKGNQRRGVEVTSTLKKKPPQTHTHGHTHPFHYMKFIALLLLTCLPD